jgi:hypothetical protein
VFVTGLNAHANWKTNADHETSEPGARLSQAHQDGMAPEGYGRPEQVLSAEVSEAWLLQ